MGVPLTATVALLLGLLQGVELFFHLGELGDEHVDVRVGDLEGDVQAIFVSVHGGHLWLWL